MRKILMTKHLDTQTFEIEYTLVEKSQEETKIIHKGPFASPPKPKYTVEEQQQIDMCNAILADKDLPHMSEEEVEYFLDPNGTNKRLSDLSEKMKDTKTLQQLAGFAVEKTIRPV